MRSTIQRKSCLTCLKNNNKNNNRLYVIFFLFNSNYTACFCFEYTITILRIVPSEHTCTIPQITEIIELKDLYDMLPMVMLPKSLITRKVFYMRS